MRDPLHLLDMTGEAILMGRFDELPALIEATEAWLAAHTDPAAGGLEAIRSRAARNRSLIRAAQAGLRAGSGGGPSTALGTYGTDGRRISQGVCPAVEVKA